MRVLKFENYMRNNLKDYMFKYYPDTRVSKKALLKLSAKDSRLAEMSQVYYGSNKMVDTANTFQKFTDFKFTTVVAYLKTTNKYSYQYNSKLSSKEKLKKVFLKKLKVHLASVDVTLYRLSKFLKTNQSNLSRFMNGETKTMSVEKLKKLTTFLRRAALVRDKWS